MIRLLVVDDSALMRKLLKRVFEDQSEFETAFARDGLEAMELVESFSPDVITLDIHMPNVDGLTFLERLMRERPTPVVVVSALTTEGAETSLKAMALGAIDFVAKPSKAMSLEIDDLAPGLVAKVRSATLARLRRRPGKAAAGGVGKPEREALSPATPRPIPPRPSRMTDGLVIIGTSTGGPPALDMIVPELPADFPLPVLVAQHMPKSFTGALARRLDRVSAIGVVEVNAPTVLQPGHVYIAQGDADMIVSRRAERLIAMPAPAGPNWLWHPSVDRLVRTALDHVVASNLIGVLLTGMGSDGADAMALVKSAGGHTIAEAEESAVVWGMPGELVKRGGASVVLPVSRIAAAVVERTT